MPLTADDLVRLSAVGISSAEQIIEVARIAERHAAERDASRTVTRDDAVRAMAAERARRHREKQKANKLTAGSEVSAPPATPVTVTPSSRSVTRDASRSELVVSPAPLPLILEKTVEKDVSKKKVKGSGDARASRLPDDFTPDESCEAIAREHGFTRAHWQRTIDGFRDYWKAQPGGKGLKADWQATCRNWLRREADNMKGPGNGTAFVRPKENSIKGGFQRLRAVIDEVARRESGQGGDDGRKDTLLLPGLREGS